MHAATALDKVIKEKLPFPNGSLIPATIKPVGVHRVPTMLSRMLGMSGREEINTHITTKRPWQEYIYI